MSHNSVLRESAAGLRMLCASVFIATCQVLHLHAQPVQPLVAVHDSEFTRALESISATSPTPSGAGTTGFEWWPTNWHYFVMADSVKEMLRSDGTAFAVVGDSDIIGGSLLNSNGLPNYPIVISLASEAIRDDEITPLTNYVAAGGILFIGSSSFTRNTNGTTRGDFAFANELGLHMVNAGLTNWQANNNFTAVSSHRIISHIPQGTLTWQMPSSSEEISWPIANHPPNPPTTLPHQLWQVRPTGATILAQGDSRPFLAIRRHGKGYFIYDAAMQPLMGHGGWAPGMYAYGILRNSIEWAFQCAKAPVPRLSAWPYQYNAAVIFRHDMESDPTLINSIEVSSLFEFNHGAKGDYYFCTGQLRDNMTNNAATIASLNRAVTNYGATIASHNGGLTNINTYVPALTSNSYDYWHWGLDEVLGLSPPGYSNGVHYALVSLSNSFNDIDGWLSGTNNGGGIRHWVAPYFNATREASYQIQEQLGVQITGDQKIGPFPHWTLSTQTPDKIYDFLSVPVSDWFVGSQIGQGMENGHTTNSVRALVDYYYNLGGLINLYNHSSSDGTGPVGPLASEYVTYSVAKPAIWPANAVGIYNWWLARSNAQIAPAFSTNSNQSTTTILLSGASDTNTAVELPVLNPGYYNLQVLTNGVAAATNFYRTNGAFIRIRAGTTVTNAQIVYRVPPVANEDVYTGTQGVVISNTAPGVLANDVLGIGGTNLTASAITNPAHGSLTLNSNGGFNYTPVSNFNGVDSFLYRTSDGLTNSATVTATLMVTPPGYLFWDNMSRPGSSTNIAPWVGQLGGSIISNSALLNNSVSNSYGYAYYPGGTNWTDYVVQGRIQFPASNGFGGGIGARLDPNTGAHYGAWIYPETSALGSTVLRLIKFEGWTTWSFTPMQQVSLSSVGTNFHTITLSVQGSNITVYLDGVQRISVVDNNYDSVPPFLNGTISSDMFTFPNPYLKTVEDVAVAAAGVPVVMLQPADTTNNAGTTASFSVTALGTNLSYQWFHGGTPVPGGTNSTVNITNVTGPDGGGYSVVVTNGNGIATSSTATLTVIDPYITSQPQSRTNNAGTTASFTVGAIGDGSLVYRWFKNGNLLNNGGRISGATSSNLNISSVIEADEADYAATVANSFGSLTTAPPAHLTVIDPFITASPQSRTNNAGTTATFTVTAAGTATLNYRWFRNGSLLTNGGKISGATTTNLQISGVLGGDAGNYTVSVSNSVGVVTNSPPAVLTVIDPIVNTPPASRTNNAGTTATFTVTATGTTNLTYRWFRNSSLLTDGGKVSGATTTNLQITGVLGGDAGNYTVSVSNSFGVATSTPPAVLTVIDPIINAPPLSRTNNAGTTANFIVTATGTSTLNYRWFRNGSLLNNGGKISGATTTNLTITNVLGADAGNYTVTVSNTFGNITSTPPAVLTVIDPFINTPPNSQTNNAGTTVNFTVNASGSSTLNYRWFRNGTILNNGGKISGATTTNLTITNVLGGDAGNYTVSVSNSFGVVTSAPPAVFAVIDPFITVQPVSQTNSVGTPASFSVTAVGTTPLYQWLKGGLPINNETNAAYNIASVVASNAGNYCVIVSNTFGTATSAVAVLTVFAQPVIQSVVISNNIAYITWTSVDSQIYRLQYLDDASLTNWSDVTPDFPGTGTSTTGTNAVTNSQRYFRVFVVPP